jgi:hypothetical protein
VLVNDQPLAAAFQPDGGVPAIDLHCRTGFRSEREVKSQSHPGDIAAARNFQVAIGRELAG